MWPQEAIYAVQDTFVWCRCLTRTCLQFAHSCKTRQRGDLESILSGLLMVSNPLQVELMTNLYGRLTRTYCVCYPVKLTVICSWYDKILNIKLPCYNILEIETLKQQTVKVLRVEEEPRKDEQTLTRAMESEGCTNCSLHRLYSFFVHVKVGNVQHSILYEQKIQELGTLPWKLKCIFVDIFCYCIG